MPQSPTPIHDSVRRHYAAQARSKQSCCGGENNLYPAELIETLPDDIRGFSLGCGNPLAAAGLQPGETVLDLGSGGGLDCFLAARQVSESGRVIGVDMTAEMLARARASAARLGIANVEFREGHLESLPLEAGSVNVVISNCVINLSPDKPRVFREVFRVLKPGGRLAVSDTVTDGPLPESVRQDMEAWGGCVAGALEAGEYKAGLAAAGFTDVSIRPREEDHKDSCCQPESLVYSALITARKPA